MDEGGKVPCVASKMLYLYIMRKEPYKKVFFLYFTKIDIFLKGASI